MQKCYKHTLSVTHIAVKYIFDVWVVKYKFHLVGELIMSRLTFYMFRFHSYPLFLPSA